jgi:hypothetical protein
MKGRNQMKTQPTHTPTPWKLEKDIHKNIMFESEHNVFTGPLEMSWDDAAFIVRAVNFHQVLLNIAKNLDYARHGKFDSGCEVCQTIAAAEGSPR